MGWNSGIALHYGRKAMIRQSPRRAARGVFMEVELLAPGGWRVMGLPPLHCTALHWGHFCSVLCRGGGREGGRELGRLPPDLGSVCQAPGAPASASFFPWARLVVAALRSGMGNAALAFCAHSVWTFPAREVPSLPGLPVPPRFFAVCPVPSCPRRHCPC
ncbi:hypothetical protein KC19_7G032700 [Ceratodon purpureus]|uniref:Uncharacterized protein n=1 Tax=Ceratodon purpureus TaxID=3225 RepID=A0A8T0H5Q3_CERPU|nr:hypothetical protein KC19_7G032700 [Ceratodon purpureus]